MPAEGPDRALGASYQLEELIGRGAAGEVWRGVDRRTDEPIAAKLLRSEYVEDHELVSRFLRERSILVGLRHPNVVAVRDLVAEGDRLAIVMEYVAGGSVRAALEDGPLPTRTAVRITVATLDGLALAHERQVLHRDLKPDNLLLTTDWQETTPAGVKLSDFGVSSLLEDRRTSTTGLVGTPEYMAPELLLTGSAGLPVDLYATGVLLYELLAGRTPFAGPGTGYVVAHRHVTNLAPRLPVPDPLWQILERLLDKEPDHRPTAVEAAELLRALPEAIVDLPALEDQETPETFARAAGPPTELRGLTPEAAVIPAASPEEATAAAGGDSAVAATTARKPLIDLGERSGETVLRAMPIAVPARETESTDPVAVGRFARLRRRLGRIGVRTRWVIALSLVAAIAIGFGVYWLAPRGTTPTAPPPVVPSSAPAKQQSQPSPAGLGITRTAAWDPQQGTVRLTLTYAAERVGLSGPFVEVLPNVGGSGACPDVTWEDAAARRNLSSTTGLDTPCAWSVDPGRAPARGSVTASAEVALPALGNDPAALQEWLDTASAATEAISTDSSLTSTAYPAQRLTDIQVVAPTRTVSGKTLRITLLPVWPSGVDQLNPLFVSPPSGRPSQILTAAVGGTAGVRFADGCSGALSVSDDGLVVVAQSVAEGCVVKATAGNFPDLSSNTFAITTRGS